MKNFNEEQLWNYIDGSCSEEEKLEIEQALPENEALRLALAERMALHEALQKIEAEEPSMRFAANIMDQLQNIRITLPQLVSPRLRRAFVIAMSSISVAIIVLVSNLPESSATSGTEATPYVNSWVEWTTMIMNSPVTLLIGCLGVSFLLLSYLDGYLKKRFRVRKSI